MMFTGCESAELKFDVPKAADPEDLPSPSTLVYCRLQTREQAVKALTGM